jgi:hypothetical protein
MQNMKAQTEQQRAASAAATAAAAASAPAATKRQYDPGDSGSGGKFHYSHQTQGEFIICHDDSASASASVAVAALRLL